MFGGFWTTALVVPLILGVLAAPLFYQARRLGRVDTIKSFAIAGVVVSVIAASLAYASNQNIEQCFDSGNRGCVDAGATGMQLIFMGGYVVTAWWVARTLSDQ